MCVSKAESCRARALGCGALSGAPKVGAGARAAHPKEIESASACGAPKKLGALVWVRCAPKCAPKVCLLLLVVLNCNILEVVHTIK